jgi:hypothetical protein
VALVTDGRRILRFTEPRRTAAPAKTPDTAWLDAPGGLRIDIDVKVTPAKETPDADDPTRSGS